MSDQSHQVPENEHGIKKDLKHSFTAETVDDAEELFLIAKDRLLDVNHWKEVAAGSSAEFILTDAHGHTLSRKAHQGDYIRIDIPGPGPKEGDGFDWVHIESIAYDDYPDENSESILMQLRPAPSPVSGNNDTAHFFSDKSTSTFIIERHAKLLVAHYYGRNETPNKDTESIIDKARNVAVAVGAMLGLSDVQWKDLVKGFLNFEEYDPSVS